MQADLKVSAGRIILQGALTARGLGTLWQRATRAAADAADARLEIELSDVKKLDSSGAALILAMERRHGGEVEIIGADPASLALLAQLRGASRPPRPRCFPPNPHFGTGCGRVGGQGSRFLARR
ncbi:STAS domain-containing protein [Acidocella aminolytica]|uniref:MlaB-like STAS domain-containing protein n=1 Tax=Acidocella aminolytica 101 = DSM 11237 TaxID=1120923 RepID=A0A0D6PF87_9PROT|nr:STAS domain-containing protein [Acidocella aminolytica]GAN79868.1 hypothetical protein Aam_034_012 [Acidocella aminolytica 101 = DSM 11237]SHE60922.1 ABC-type transporter Mla maintaining outer membrane lipid asymmetry, MlaB component, contains STAS domain [Acidocella aminolytica 101 = DSM 11237]